MRHFLPLACWACLLGLATAGLTFAQAPPAEEADPPPRVASPFGYECFRGLLGYYEKKELLHPLESYEHLKAADPSRCLVIVLGDPTPLFSRSPNRGVGVFGSELAYLEYRHQGGHLFCATDQTTNQSNLGLSHSLLVQQQWFESPDPTQNCYQGTIAECIQLVPERSNLANQLFGTLDHPVYTNSPSRLVFSHPVEPLARLKPPVRPTFNPLGERNTSLTCAASHAHGSSRLLIFADQSIFINCMMLQRDTGNFQLANQSLRWLLENASPRNPLQVLYIEDGEVKTKFEALVEDSKTQTPKPPKLDLVQIANAVLAGVQEDEIAQQFLSSNLPRRGLLLLLLILLSAGLFFYGFYRLGQRSYSVERAAPLLTETIPAVPKKVSRLKGRIREMVLSDAGTEPAQFLARSFFDRLQNETDWPIAADQLTSTAPRVGRTSGSWLQRWRIQRALHYYWQLAYSPAPPRVSSKQLPQLVEALQQLLDAYRAGDFQVVKQT